MALNVLILGASYGSLLATKILMAGHDATLVCRAETADLINAEGTDIRMMLPARDAAQSIRSGAQPGRLTAAPPEAVDLARYDLVALAMSEPQYGAPAIRALMARIGAAGLPCLSIMNMPPLPYLRRIPGLDVDALADCYTAPEVWAGFDPAKVTLASPDAQAYRTPETPANVLHVSLASNFKAAAFADPELTAMLTMLQDDISAVRIGDRPVPVRLLVYDSLFVPFAKWAMLLTGNYRSVLPQGVRSIRDAVASQPDEAEGIYEAVNGVVRHLGADDDDLVPFASYARAARRLTKPSSVARAIEGGATHVERVDLLVKRIADQLGRPDPRIDAVAATIDARLQANRAG